MGIIRSYFTTSVKNIMNDAKKLLLIKHLYNLRLLANNYFTGFSIKFDGGLHTNVKDLNINVKKDTTTKTENNSCCKMNEDVDDNNDIFSLLQKSDKNNSSTQNLTEKNNKLIKVNMRYFKSRKKLKKVNFLHCKGRTRPATIFNYLNLKSGKEINLRCLEKSKNLLMSMGVYESIEL